MDKKVQFIENDAEIIYEGKKLRFDTTEGIQRAEAFIRMKEVIDLETGLKVPRTKVSFCYNSLTPKAPSEPFVVPCIEGRGRKKKGENLMTHVVMRFPSCVCVPIPVRTQATRTIKGSDPITAKIALEIAKKWVKITYGNIDYMCGIHIDQPDMLVHFLLFTKEASEKGEENARKLFIQYRLDKWIDELKEEDILSNDSEESHEELEEIIQEKPRNTFGNMPKMEFPTASSTGIKQDSREQVMTKMKQETLFAAKPSERQNQIDIASIVAKVRASSSFQMEAIAETIDIRDGEKETEIPTKKEELFSVGTANVESKDNQEKNLILAEETKQTEWENEKEIIEVKASNSEKENHENLEQKEEADLGKDEEPTIELDPLAKIKANAANTLFGLSRVLDPGTKEEKESEIAEEETIKEEQEEKKEAVFYTNPQYEEKKEETNLQTKEKTEGSSAGLVGSVMWGTEAEEEQFPEEKKVQAVFSTRNLSVMAEDSNPYLEEELDELPEISFFVQNEAGEKETPEEFDFEPSQRTLQQRDAAANYVKGIKRAKWKKIGLVLVLVILAVILFLILR